MGRRHEDNCPLCLEGAGCSYRPSHDSGSSSGEHRFNLGRGGHPQRPWSICLRYRHPPGSVACCGASSAKREVIVVFAAISTAEAVSVALGIMGIAGLVFTALKFNRDDTTSIVNQQNTILGDMKILNEELRTTTDRLRVERDELRTQVDRLTGQLDAFRDELRDRGERLERVATRVEERLGDG